MTGAEPPLIVVSNRGPVTFDVTESGELAARRGVGGLVSSLRPLVRDAGALWVAAAMSEGDRRQAARGAADVEDFRVRYLDIDPADYARAYNVISNGTLWFLLHGLFDGARRPRLDRQWREAWDAYRDVNRAFARTVAEAAPEGAVVLVQDYHLALVGTWLTQERPDLRTVHFTHIPFCEPQDLRMLPADVAAEMLAGMSCHQSCGFHSRRWADNFSACAREVLGWAPSTFVSPLAPDASELAEAAGSAECEAEVGRIDEMLAGRKLILRVDRIELSKNLLRGFWAFDELLETHPEWRQRVTFLAISQVSREELLDYAAYRTEVETLVARLNERWGTPSWTPVVLDTSGSYARSLAGLRCYDVLLVNPVRDGLNLVCKEGPIVNERDGVVALSREAGAWEELGGAALEVNPFDVGGTAQLLAQALTMTAAERQVHADLLRKAVGARKPAEWLAEQRAAAAGG